MVSDAVLQNYMQSLKKKHAERSADVKARSERLSELQKVPSWLMPPLSYHFH